MKLYTEEQMKEAVKIGFRNFFSIEQDLINLANEKLKQFTPIELPNDEEIEKGIDEYIISPFEKLCWKCGAKWVIDKIKNQ